MSIHVILKQSKCYLRNFSYTVLTKAINSYLFCLWTMCLKKVSCQLEKWNLPEVDLLIHFRFLNFLFDINIKKWQQTNKIADTKVQCSEDKHYKFLYYQGWYAEIFLKVSSNSNCLCPHEYHLILTTPAAGPGSNWIKKLYLPGLFAGSLAGQGWLHSNY